MDDSSILCSDVIFKSIFMKYPNILSKFIYDITGYKLNNIKLICNEMPITRYKEKFKRCDFLIYYGNKIINIELNDSYSKTLLIKNTSYAFGLFSSYTSKGKKYPSNLEIIQINVNNFSRFDKPILDYKVMNNNYGYTYIDGLKIFDLDIVKSKNMYYNADRLRNYIRWGALFSCENINDMKPILYELINSRREVDRMIEDLYNLTAPGKVISEKLAMELDDKFRRSLKAEGRAEGREEGRAEGREEGIKEKTNDMIKSMLENSADYEFISKVSGKTINEIKEIEKSMKD